MTFQKILRTQQGSKTNFSCQVMSSYGQCSMEKLASDLLLRLKFVKLELLSTSLIDFLHGKLGELRSRWINNTVNYSQQKHFTNLLHIL